MINEQIFKALKCCQTEYNRNCKECPYEKYKQHSISATTCSSELRKDLLDLINHQEEEKQNLEIELQAMRNAANGFKAEVERLKVENKLLIDNDVSNKYPNCVSVEKGRIYTRTLKDYDELIGDISAEAYKECIEKVTDKAELIRVNAFEGKWAISQDDLDNLLNELVGDDR